MKAAIFDLDGTILDSTHAWDRVGSRYLESIGVKPDDDLEDKLAVMTVEMAAAYTKQRYHLRQTEQEIIEGVLDIIKDFYFYKVQSKKGAKEFLQALKQARIPTAAATAGDKELARRALERLGLMELFTEFITCTEVGASKQKPDIYLEGAKRLGTEPEETWVFEDVLHALQTAKQAHFHTVAIKDDNNIRSEREILAIADDYLEDWSQVWNLPVIQENPDLTQPAYPLE